MIKVMGLALYGDKAASTRYRLFQYKSLLEESGIELEVFSLLSNEYLVKKFNGERISLIDILVSVFNRIKILLKQKKYDCAIVHCEIFPLLPGKIESLILNIPFIYDFDDAFYLKYQSKRFQFTSPFLANKFLPVIKRASFVTAGNNTLLNYANSINENVFLLPTVVDTVRYKVLKKTVTNALTVGWIGSPSTAPYLKGISKSLSILAESQDMRFVVIGGKAPFIKNVDVIELPWNEDTEVNEINNFDIGIMPLPDSPWERGKCGFKLIQYMACGLPVIASPVGVNSEIVEHGVNGFLAETQEEWEAALSTLIADSDLRQQMGKAGREKVEREYSLQVTGPKLVALLKSIS